MLITDFILAFILLHVMGINIRPVYLVFSFLVLHQRRNRERSYGTLELRTSMASHNHHCRMFPLELTNNWYCIVRSTVEIKYLLTTHRCVFRSWLGDAMNDRGSLYTAPIT